MKILLFYYLLGRENNLKKRNLNINKKIFIPTILIFVVVSIMLILGGNELYNFAVTVLNFITNTFGSAFLLIYVANFIFLGWLTFSKYGNIKLGDPDEEPEYSNLSWSAMVFTTGIDASIMIMALFEPIHYLTSPPFEIEPFTNAAYDYAHMYGQFHWGPSAWTMYIPGTIAIAYTLFVKKSKTTSVSSACSDVLGKKRNWTKNIIDLVVVFGIMGGLGASLGLEIPVISEIISQVFNIENTMFLKLVMLGILFIIIGGSVYLGLDKGIKVLSSINIISVIIFLLILFLLGPTKYIINAQTNSLGLLFDNFIKMSLYTDPNTLSGFPQQWTVFYWGWWLVYMPVMGLFVARISRGRTIRQVVKGQVIWGSVGCMTFFAIMGGYSLYVQKAGIVNVAQILATYGQEAAIAAILGTLPLPTIMLLIYCVICFIFLATTVDSSAYILGSLTSKKLSGYEQPARWNRMLWAVVFMLFAVGIMAVGGFETIQVVCVIAGFPLIFVCILLMRSIYLMVKDYPNNAVLYSDIKDREEDL